MAQVLSSLAERLLARIDDARTVLLRHVDAGEAMHRVFDSLQELLVAGVAGLTDAQLVAPPSLDEWSISEVLDHIAEHDSEFAEFDQLGIEHYVEHGLEHALQLWRLRLGMKPPEGNV